ncbi:hypothetical protein JW721_02450 [Candidatus Micrarchaeota archaeon]|nr:hypothetical protein [Candidatus Micrarchaeota archaeon]
MPKSIELSNALNRAWKSTTKVLFGEELGEMREYKEWLLAHVTPPRKEVSALSGKDVFLGVKAYCSGAKFAGFSEIDFNRKIEPLPLSINEIKDMDSIVSALEERSYYTGNVVLGNSNFVEDSANVIDSSYIYGSTEIIDGKYLAYVSISPQGEYSFGGNGVGTSRYCIHVYETFDCSRCFELWNSRSCSDSYYVFNCDGCSEMFFCFNEYGKKYEVGNVPLPKDKYLGLKAKLLGEIGGELHSRKKVKSIIDVVRGAKFYDAGHAKLRESLRGRNWGKKEENMQKMEDEFSKTTSLLLGKPLYGLDNYRKWMEKHTWLSADSESSLTKRKIVVADYCNLAQIPPNRLILKEEWEAIRGEVSLTQVEAESITLANVEGIIGKIAYMPFDYSVNNRNIPGCSTAIHSSNSYRVVPLIYSKNCAVSSWARYSENIFGSSAMLESSFCLNSYYSKKLNRSFETDSSKYCTGLYFCHNCENVHDSFFTFNAKNIKNAVGNVQLPSQEYKSVRGALLEQVHSELESKKELKWDIYNIGCGK